MKINFIRLENFRNIEFADVQLDSDSVWIYGKNAQGKTNILEALGLLFAMRSFRTTDMSAMIRHSTKQAQILTSVTLQTGETYEIRISIADKRKVFIDDEEIKFSDFIGKFPALAMSNDDIKLLRGSPEIRRKDIDMFISSIDKTYFLELKKYHSALIQRNALLKTETATLPEFRPFEIQMAESAQYIFSARENILNILGNYSTELYEIIAKENGESANIKIKPSCVVETIENFIESLDKYREKDVLRGSTSHGPHRDDFKILIADKDAKLYASEGQQRSAVIAMKLAQFKLLKEKANRQPVILCDDILGELDATRREAFWQCIDKNAQVIATSTLDVPNSNIRNNWKKIFVTNGKYD